MSNTVIQLKYSTVGGNTPLTLANGELALNSYDGVIYYAGPDGNIIGFDPWPGPSGSGHEIQFNDFGSLGANANLQFNKSTGIFSTKQIHVTNSAGDEGGEILLAKAVTNTSLTGTGITIDSFQNKIRFFEQGGSARGAYIDLTECVGGAGTNLLNPTSTPDSIARSTANAAFIAANSAGVAANTPSHVANSASIYANGAFITANSAGSYANSAFIHANAAFNKANTGGALTVSLTDDSNNFTNVVTSVTGIRFDANSGFDITDLGSGNVKVAMNSTFKTWKITGQQDLIANGLDTIEFVGSNGVVLTSNTLASPKTIKFDTSSVFNQANSAFEAANSANILAQTAFNTANIANTRTIINGLGNSKLDFNTYGANTAYLTTTSDDSTALFMGAVSADLYAHTNILIRANTGGTSQTWTFDADGTLTFPDTTVQTTAFTGSAIDQVARDTANAGFNQANSANVLTQASFNQANSAFQAANSASVYANSAFSVANSANTLYVSDIPPNSPTANTLWWQSNTATLKIYYNDGTSSQWVDTNQSYPVDNLARIRANAAFDAANSAIANTGVDIWARGQSNAAFLVANSAAIAANTPSHVANSASVYANGAFEVANSAAIAANTPSHVANSAAIAANTPSHVANSASIYANGAFEVANSAAIAANTPSNVANSSFIQANAAFTIANNAFTYANGTIAWNTANAAFDAANNALDTWVRGQANSAFIQANAAFLVANAAFTAANGTIAWNTANAAFIQANTGLIYAQSSFEVANSAAIAANTPSHVANSAAIYANGAFATANNEAGVNATQNNSITASFTAANSAGIYANGAFTRANNALNANTGGTITGDVSITGNLSVIGNTFTISATNLVANDTLILLGAGNYTSDLLDIGISAHYNDGVNAHTGLIRDHGTKEWQLFEGYIPEIGANNDIIISDPSFRIATLNANVHSTKILLKGIDLLPYVNNAYLTANTAFNTANNEAGVNLTQNTNISFAWNHANSAFDKANNESGVNATQNNTIDAAFIAANSSGSYANSAFLAANTADSKAVSAGSYANSAFDKANISSDVANSASIYANGAFFTANTADVKANSAGIYANGAFALANNEAGVNATQNTNISFAWNHANSAFDKANTGGADQYSRDTSNAAFIQANSALIHAQSAFDLANSAAIAANTPSHVANSAAIYANGAFGVANNEAGVNATQNTNIQFAWNHANAAFDQANTGGSGVRINVYNANTNVFTETANGTGNTFVLGFTPNSANNIIVSANGVVQYDYSLSGSTLLLNFTPSVGTFIRVQSFGSSQANSLNGIFETGNLIIYDGNTLVSLANTNAPGTYGNSTHIPVITTDSYGRVITVTNTAITGVSAIDQFARDTANIAFVEANDALYFANVAWDAANAAHTDANAAFLVANAAFTSANGVIAWNTANAAFNAANNEAGVNATQNTNISFAWNHANAAFNQANTGGGGASVSVGDDPPAAPTANSLWWQSNTGELKIYYNDGTSSQWVDAFSSAYSLDQWARDHANAAFIQANTGGGGGASVSVSDSPPISPTANSLWWQSNTATLKIYYSDGTSDQWVDASPSAYALDQDARNIANAAFLVANNAFTSANGTIAWNTANAAFNHANAAFNTANTVNNTGTAAFAAANTSSNTFMIFAVSDENTAITMGGGKTRFRAPFGMTIYQIPRASLNTASSSGDVVVDINENGTSILGVDKLSIDAGEKTSTSAAVPTTLATTTIADDAEITIDIDSAGTNANGLKVTLYFRRT